MVKVSYERKCLIWGIWFENVRGYINYGGGCGSIYAGIVRSGNWEFIFW